ncbi:energy transducer TonB, partial [Aurantiacibacter xanthus]
PTSRATPAPSPTPSTRPTSGGSRIGADFLEGSSASTGTRGSPAATFGQTERAALSSAITRALRPNWTAPSGVDADQLVTVVAWKLNRDGTLNGQPRCIGQRGITDSNRPQAQLHCERAIRAVQLANFSSLPEQFYSRWNDLEWEFDRRL